ncbi:sensor histidine kinase [Desertivirga brevis]|uniref:sensor histidine kinase n=1 Tax=Desertivirga brevis TaxID=2810310 RepID=UPI001A95F0A9|nr:PAS domain-containing sensor histidine kinase [Pedobacter sp. SYSU D00873]
MSDNKIDKKLLDTLIDPEELYQNAPCGYLSFLPDGTIIKVNKTLANWLGYLPDEIVYVKKFTDLISKGAALHFEMFFRPLVNATGVVNQLSYDILKKDGTSIPVFLSAVAFKTPEGKVQAVNATFYDVRERKLYELELLRAKKKAEAERKRFEFLSDFNPEIIWTANSSGEIDYVNKRFYQLFNTWRLSLKEILLKVCPDDRFKVLRTWFGATKQNTPFEVAIRLENQAGAFEWHNVKADVYKDDTSGARWVGSCTNIDSQVKSIQKRDEFINIASHELKTPITSLKAYHQILQRMTLPLAANNFLSRANTSLNTLQFLVSSLLDVSKIDSGQLNLSITSFSLKEVIEEAVELVAAIYPTHSVIKRLNSEDEYCVYADRQRILQVVINLLSNAVKYSPRADKVEIILVRSENENLIKVEIKDFGMGIPPDKLDLIFDKYYRVSNTKNNNQASGLGLGLFIIQNIMKQHQSRILVDSEVNKGSRFYFSLPASTVQNFKTKIPQVVQNANVALATRSDH